MLGKVCEHGSLKRQCRICELEAEVTRLSGKTGFCLQCEKYARENERLREALEKILKHHEFINPTGFSLSMTWRVAKSALGEKKC